MPRYAWWGLIVLAVLSCCLAIGYVVATGQDVAGVILSIPILIIATATLWFTIPKRAQLRIDRLGEAELDDLIFFIYPQPNPNHELQIPRDYLLQLHVAVANIGDRKAVLSVIVLDGFRNERGEVVHLPDAPVRVAGARWIQQSGWVNTQRHFQNVSVPAPYILESGDAIVVRFRVRRGIDWSDRWTPDALAEFVAPLRSPIASGFGTVVWRRGGETIRDEFEVQLTVQQQTEYVRLIEELSAGFTVQPRLPQEPIQLE